MFVGNTGQASLPQGRNQVASRQVYGQRIEFGEAQFDELSQLVQLHAFVEDDLSNTFIVIAKAQAKFSGIVLEHPLVMEQQGIGGYAQFQRGVVGEQSMQPTVKREIKPGYDGIADTTQRT